MKRRFGFFLVAALVAAQGPTCAAQAARPAAPRLVVVSWDGAADAVVDRLLAEGRLPNVARLRSEGAAAGDPATGKPVVTRVFRVEELGGMGVGGPLAGDLYLDLAPGYYPSRALAERPLSPTRVPWGEGVHGFWPERREMHAIFYVRGPGIHRGVTVAPTRHVDVAPTLARLLGIPAPAQATGRVVEELLAEPSYSSQSQK